MMSRGTNFWVMCFVRYRDSLVASTTEMLLIGIHKKIKFNDSNAG